MTPPPGVSKLTGRLVEDDGMAGRARGAPSRRSAFVRARKGATVRPAGGVHIVLAALLAAGCGRSADGLRGTGSSFVKPIMDEWAEQYARARGGSVNYQPNGSTAGILSMLEKVVDFGATDTYLTGSQLQEALDARGGGAVVHIPLVLGGIVPAYHLEGVSEPLNFTGEVLAEIYLGRITRWNDDRMRAINPGVPLPDREIAVCYRFDGSGSTSIFTEYLCKVSPDFKARVGRGTKVAWPVGGGENGTAGVAGFLRKTPNSIGYVELTYAVQNDIPSGKVKNRAGNFVAASLSSVREAAVQTFREHEPPADLRFSITDAPGADSYPLAGTTWAVCYARQPADTVRQLVDFLSWVVHDGQQYAAALHYAPLPDALVRKIDARLASIVLSSQLSVLSSN